MLLSPKRLSAYWRLLCFVAALCLVLSHLLALAIAEDNNPEGLHQKAYKLQAAGKYEEAIELYTQIIAKYPKVKSHCARAYLRIGECLRYLKRHGEAIEALNKVEAECHEHRGPHWYEVYNWYAIFTKGLCYEDLGKFADAKEIYINVIHNYANVNLLRQAQLGLTRVCRTQGSYSDSLVQAKILFYICEPNATSMIEAIRSIISVLNSIDGDTSRAVSFLEFQRLGSGGQDGKLGNEDDLKNPLDAVLPSLSDKADAAYGAMLSSQADSASGHRNAGYICLLRDELESALDELMIECELSDSKSYEVAIKDVLVAGRALKGNFLGLRDFPEDFQEKDAEVYSKVIAHYEKELAEFLADLEALEQELSGPSFFSEFRTQVLWKFTLWEQIETGKHKVTDKGKALRWHVRQLARLQTPAEKKMDSIRSGHNKKLKAQLESAIEKLDKEVFERFKTLNAKYTRSEHLGELNGYVMVYLFLTREDQSVVQTAQEIFTGIGGETSLLAIANVAMNMRKRRIAEDLYEKIIKGAPQGEEGIEVREAAAEGLVGIEQYTKAISLYEKIIERFPDTDYATEAKFSIIELYASELHSTETAVKLCNELIEKHPDENVRVRAKLSIGRSLYLAGRYDKAIRALEPLIGRFDEIRRGAEARMPLALSYMDQRDYKRAIQILRELVGKYPNDRRSPRAQYTIGGCYMRLQMLTEAEVEYQKAVDIYPGTGYANLAKRMIRSLHGTQK